MITFLFWNLHKNLIQELVATIPRSHSVDVIVLAECSITPLDMLRNLNRSESPQYQRIAQVGCDKIEFYAKFGNEFLRPIEESNRWSIRRLIVPGALDMLLAAVHLVDSRNWSRESQASECKRLGDAIRAAEERIGHQRTVLVGDLNMDPFVHGVVDENGLHGVMSRQIAQETKRIIQGRAHTYFYNPMWRLLGDDMFGAPGSYYYSNAEPVLYFWHLFDQMLIRPALLTYFRPESLAVLQAAGERSLLTARGIPNSNISDHLPIIFSLGL